MAFRSQLSKSDYEIITPEKQGGYQVQGQSATVYEWRVALAFTKLKLPFMFQFSLLGGRTRRGGFVLDFLVFTVPLSTPCDVRGEYWHQGRAKAEDDYQMAILKNAMGYNLAKPVILWGAELQSDEEALSVVRREFRV
jgi:hypothetical protein